MELGDLRLERFVTRDELSVHLGALGEIRTFLARDIGVLMAGQKDLADRLEGIHQLVTDETGQIKNKQEVANGRTTENEKAVVAAKAQIAEVQKSVTHLETFGCGVLGRHEDTLTTLKVLTTNDDDGTPRKWKPTPKQAGIGAGLVGGGAILAKVLELATAWLTHGHTMVK
jgi:hypothetical protein